MATGSGRPMPCHGAHGPFDHSGPWSSADEVVVATGSFPMPRIPAIASELPARVTQLH
jgi:hypothetical protein